MMTQRLRELVDALDSARRDLIRLRGKDPDDPSVYRLFPPVTEEALERAQTESGLPYPPSYRQFLLDHNGWRGFWQAWNLVGVENAENRSLNDEVRSTIALLPTVADEGTLASLREDEKTNPDVILVTNHPVLGVDFNGSLMVFDRNRRADGGECEVVWVQYGMHVTRRWRSFEALLDEAARDTQGRVAKGGAWRA